MQYQMNRPLVEMEMQNNSNMSCMMPNVQQPNFNQQQQPNFVQPQYQHQQQQQQQQYSQTYPIQQTPMQSMIVPVLKRPTSRESQVLSCQICRLPVQSQIEFKVGKGAYIFSMLALLKTGVCCLVPCMIQGCKDAVHKCPHCQQEIGRKRFMFE